MFICCIAGMIMFIYWSCHLLITIWFLSWTISISTVHTLCSDGPLIILLTPKHAKMGYFFQQCTVFCYTYNTVGLTLLLVIGHHIVIIEYIDGLERDCSNSSALAMELLQSCTKSSICNWMHWYQRYFHNFVGDTYLDFRLCYISCVSVFW